jgi:hypothetical protein
LVADPLASYCELENWKKEQHMFPLDQLASVLSYDEPFLLPSKRGLVGAYNLERLLSFLRRDFQGGLDYQHQPFVQFQLRYFRPIDESRARKGKARYPCFLGDRQRAIIGRCSAGQYLEEKRARVSLRVFDSFPGLFNILILADDYMSPEFNGWSRSPEGEFTELNWARHELKPCGKGTAITHYMFKVSRVVERSLGAWSNALDSIDKLVHVNVSNDKTKEHSPRS